MLVGFAIFEVCLLLFVGYLYWQLFRRR